METMAQNALRSKPVRCTDPHGVRGQQRHHTSTTMGNRLTQIATRTGDAGTTGLGNNQRVSKNSLRVHAMGDVDELNSHIGQIGRASCRERV